MAVSNNNHTEKLVDQRCCSCNSLLARVSLQEGKVQIKCRCGTVNTFEAAADIKPEGQISRPKATGDVHAVTGHLSVKG